MIFKNLLLVDNKLFLHKFTITHKNNKISVNTTTKFTSLTKIPIYNKYTGLYYDTILFPLEMIIYEYNIFHPYIIHSTYNIKTENDFDFFYNLENFIFTNYKLKFYNFNNLIYKKKKFTILLNQIYSKDINYIFTNQVSIHKYNQFTQNLWININIIKIYILFILINFPYLEIRNINELQKKYDIPQYILILAYQIKKLKYNIIFNITDMLFLYNKKINLVKRLNNYNYLNYNNICYNYSYLNFVCSIIKHNLKTNKLVSNNSSNILFKMKLNKDIIIKNYTKSQSFNNYEILLNKKLSFYEYFNVIPLTKNMIYKKNSYYIIKDDIISKIQVIDIINDFIIIDNNIKILFKDYIWYNIPTNTIDKAFVIFNTNINYDFNDFILKYIILINNFSNHDNDLKYTSKNFLYSIDFLNILQNNYFNLLISKNINSYEELNLLYTKLNIYKFTKKLSETSKLKSYINILTYNFDSFSPKNTIFEDSDISNNSKGLEKFEDSFTKDLLLILNLQTIKILEYYLDDHKLSNLILISDIINVNNNLSDFNILKNNSFQDEFFYYITKKYSHNKNNIYSILLILFKIYSYPLKPNRHEIDNVFDYILFFSLYNYKYIFNSSKLIETTKKNQYLNNISIEDDNINPTVTKLDSRAHDKVTSSTFYKVDILKKYNKNKVFVINSAREKDEGVSYTRGNYNFDRLKKYYSFEYLNFNINLILPDKFRNLYINITKTLNQILNNKYDLITYNYKFYNDYLHKTIIKLFFIDTNKLSVNYFKAITKSIIFNNFQTILSTNLILIDIGNKITWLNLPKKLNYLKFYYNNPTIIYYKNNTKNGNIINKNLITDKFDEKIKKIIETPFIMYKYLKKKNDFIKWTNLISSSITNIYYIPINLFLEDIKHIGIIFYFLFNLTEQNINNKSYYNFIKFCNKYINLILDSNKINIKFKEVLPYLRITININNLIKDILLFKNLENKGIEISLIKDNLTLIKNTFLNEKNSIQKNDKLILYNSPKLTTQLLYELLRSFVDIIIQYPNTIICWQKYRDKNSFKIIKLNNKIFVFIKQTNNCHNYLTKIIFYLIKYEKCNNFTIKLIDSFISSNRLIIEK